MGKIIGSGKIWFNFIRPGLEMAGPNFSAAVAAKTKNKQEAQTYSNILKSISGGKVVSSLGMHGVGQEMRFI